MRFLVIAFTVFAVLLFARQFLGPKGTKLHIVSGALVGLLSVAVVAINTISVSLQRGLVWNATFITHTVLGTAFFLSLIATCILGWQTTHKRKVRIWHRRFATMTGVFLFLTLFAAIMIRFVR